MNPPLISILATVFFACALVHSFLIKRFEHLALRYPEGSIGENVFHTLGEVEVVFGLWAAFFLFTMVAIEGNTSATAYLHHLNFREPLFVFAIMTICATRPILNAATWLIRSLSRGIPVPKAIRFYVATLVIGPLLGSVMTEPAAMTVTALILKQYLYDRGASPRLMYATLGLLFVNISIGGTLTPYAAPPVLMVADTWNWDLAYMLSHFGWKAALAILVNTVIVARGFKTELAALGQTSPTQGAYSPRWLTIAHLAFLVAVVASAHHVEVFLGFFLFFLGLTSVSKEYQDELKIREALLVAFFLGGLVVLGSSQDWWLTPLLGQLGSGALFLGASVLTAITDNAALTYLGSLVPNLSDFSKYALVAGSVVGGGLTVIANAPNPAGFGILNHSFGPEGISPLKLLIAALPFTLIAGLCFWFLP